MGLSKCIGWILIFIPCLLNAQTTGSTTTGYGAFKFQSYAATTTFTPPNGVGTVTVELWGAGGNGGSATNSGTLGGGGAGTNYVRGNVSVTANTSYTVTVGLTAAGNGTAGADSWFNTTGTIICKGGAGGANATGGSGAAGAATTTGCIGTTINIGGNGGSSAVNSGAGGGSAGSTGAGGNASTSTAGIGVGGGGNGAQGQTATNSAGINATGVGGGGSGGKAGNATIRAGGQGASGRVIIEQRTTHLGFM